jgi:hypothetical protein
MFTQWTTKASALFPAAIVLAVAASPSTEPTAEQLIREANAAFIRQDFIAADQLYDAAGLVASDPGLVAFNHAAVQAENQNYVEAAKSYDLVINDAACPPERAAKAWYNRGTCLLHHPSATAAVYRSAIACLDRCLNSQASDPPLKANARYNLKLAKLLWNEARKKEKRDDNPNTNLPPEERQDQIPKPIGSEAVSGENAQGEGKAPGNNSDIVQQPGVGEGTRDIAKHTQAMTPGATGQLQPLEDKNEIQPLSPEQTREYLRHTAERLRRAQQLMRRTLYGGERSGSHDW